MVTFQVCLNRTSGLLCWIHTTTIVGNHADIAFPDYALPLCTTWSTAMLPAVWN